MAVEPSVLVTPEEESKALVREQYALIEGQADHFDWQCRLEDRGDFHVIYVRIQKPGGRAFLLRLVTDDYSRQAPEARFVNPDGWENADLKDVARAEFYPNRRFPLVVLGVDRDDVRWEVQRDLPHTLVDGSTGAQANLRVERVAFAEAGCIGCSRPPQRNELNEEQECDAPPDPNAPSISFLSGMAGTLAAGEMLKSLMGVSEALVGHFDHVFTYSPNPDLVGRTARRPDCPVACGQPNVQQAFEAKWGKAEGE